MCKNSYNEDKKNILSALLMLQRYDMEIQSVGVDYDIRIIPEAEKYGDYVKWEDVVAIINKY